MAETGPGLRRLKPPFLHLGGRQWFAASRPGAGGYTDDVVFPSRSRLRLFEDAVELGPAHAAHTEIAKPGAGRYAHWSDGLRFSTSDGSDPNSNGRTYAYRLARKRPTVLIFGACHLHEAAGLLEEKGRLIRSTPSVATVNSTAEIRQLVEGCVADREGPGLVEPVCAMPKDLPLAVRRRFIAEADVVVVEIAAPLIFEFGGWALNSGFLRQRLVNPAQARNRRAWHAGGRWYGQGLLRQQEETRVVEGGKLLRALGDGVPEWTRAVVTEARVRRQTFEEMAEDLLWLRRTTGKPLIVASTAVIYTEGGRAVSFTPNFFAKLSELGERHGLNILHPHQMIEKMGVKRALTADRAHLTPAGRAAYATALARRIGEAVSAGL